MSKHFSVVFRANSRVRYWVLGVSGLFLSACSVTPNPMPEMKGTAFHTTLYNGYQDLAQLEFAENDYDDSRYFSNKSLRAATGEDVKPDVINSRLLDDATKQAATTMRSALMEYLTDPAALFAVSEAAARAQVGFDCWLQESEEGHQQDDIAACKASFDLHMQRLDEWAARKTSGMTTSTGDVEVTGALALLASDKDELLSNTSASMKIYFALDSADILPAEQSTIRSIVAAIATTGATSIKLVGHTDRSGRERYNENLGYMRAEAVYNALRKAGVEGVTAALSSLGETLPQVQTVDGVPEPLNRRVMVILLH